MTLADVARAAGATSYVLLFPPFLLGVIARTKARFGGRRGPPLLQPYYDIVKLLRRDSVVSRTTTWLFYAGPAVALVSTLVGVSLVPLGDGRALWSFDGDFVVLAYVLGLARCFTMLAALDTGSSFEGMGAAREATFACFAEPAFILGVMTIARATGSLSLAGFLGPKVSHLWSIAAPSLVLVAAGLFVVLLAENSRIPIDDPNTHLELTMIHEVMVLDHGGPMLGVILYASAIKLFIFGTVLVRIVVPIDGYEPLAWASYTLGLVVVAIVVGVIESTMARLRMPNVAAVLLAACLLCALAVVLQFR